MQPDNHQHEEDPKDAFFDSLDHEVHESGSAHSEGEEHLESPGGDLTWVGRNSALERVVAQPLRRFLHIEASGGILLIVATAIALIWVNSQFGDSYFSFWHTPLHLTVGNFPIFDGDIHALVNDALMVLFFFVVGLEIKREMVTGRLSRPRDVILPVGAAVGGMLVPALIYVAFNAGTENLNGWGIPMATDIAFAVGVVSLLGKRTPSWLKLFLLTLAIADDIGAIAVIAIFYSSNISMGWLALAIGVCLLIATLTRVRVWHVPTYVLLGLVVWWATYRSGVHATIAGVALGLMTPARPLQTESGARSVARWLERKKAISLNDIRRAGFNITESRSMAERLERTLHPFVSYLVVPVFALANAGVVLSREMLASAVTSRVTLGVAIGLLVGNTVGVSFFTWLVTKFKLGRLPPGINGLHVLGISIVAGIGFTVSLFITVLAFEGDDGEHVSTETAAVALSEADAEAVNESGHSATVPTVEDQAKIGVLGGSLIAFLVGLSVLWLASRREEASQRGLVEEDT